MAQILLGVSMMVTGLVVMFSAAGVSGGHKARRARLAALGRWPAILVLGVVIGLLLTGFFEILLWVEDHNTKPVLSREIFLVVTSLGIGVYGSWLLWRFLELIDPDDVSLSDLLPKRTQEKGAPRTLADIYVAAIPATEQGEKARRILDERRRTLRRSRIIGAGGAVLLVAFGILIALQSGARFAGGIWGFVIAAYFHYRVIVSWFRARPRSVLLLRRFTGFDDQRFVVARVLGEACSALAVPITIQDDSFRGDIPIALEALERYIALPLAFIIIPLLLLMVAPRPVVLALGEIGAVASVLALGAALYWLFNSVMKRRAVIRAGVPDYRARLEDFFDRIRTRMVMYSGTRVMRFSNDAWRDAIELCLDEVDCVVVDITDMSENVAWEVGAVYRRFPPEAVLLVWEYDAGGQPVDGGSIPATLLDRLSLVVPREKIERSRRLARPAEGGRLAEVVMKDKWTVEIAQCLAADAQREAPATGQNA